MSNIKTDKACDVLDGILHDCGGFGRFQFVLIAIILLAKTPCAWSLIMMSVVGVKTDWWCVGSDVITNATVLLKNSSTLHVCTAELSAEPSSVCSRYEFSTDLTTVVGEWDLVCDNDWVVDAITTIQMCGLLVTGVFTGQLSDTVGRRPTFILSLVLFLVLNILAPFSVSWQMFAVVRFFIGVAAGCMLTVYVVLLIEYLPHRWRAVVVAIPLWSIEAALLGPLAMWLHDWKYLHYATAASAFPFLCCMWFVPESFRWLVSRNKIKEAQKVIARMAKFNGRDIPDLSLVSEVAIKIHRDNAKKHYTLKDLCNNIYLIKITIIQGIGWMSSAYVYYAIAFGVRNLSGNLYVNLVLVSIVEIPSIFFTWFLNNRIGRRWTVAAFFVLSGAAGLATGAFQTSDLVDKGDYVNILALTCKLGVAAGWAALQIFTSELYPTVVRNIGYGFLSTVSRIGGLLAPQILYVDETSIDGILYYSSGGMMFLSAIVTLFLPETNNKSLQDLIDDIDEETKHNIYENSISYGTLIDKE